MVRLFGGVLFLKLSLTVAVLFGGVLGVSLALREQASGRQSTAGCLARFPVATSR
ncbi:MAG: hypothetical protein NDI93_15300 [Pseudomonas sp.]|nr:hypothetical protein [Pseudomonas sp.]